MKPCGSSGVIHRLAARSCIPSLAPTKPTALGLSDHSLGLSCARPVLARSQAELALERPGEIREVVEADGVSDFLGQCRGFAALRREPDGARWPPTRLAERPWGQVMQLSKCTTERPDPMDWAMDCSHSGRAEDISSLAMPEATTQGYRPCASRGAYGAMKLAWRKQRQRACRTASDDTRSLKNESSAALKLRSAQKRCLCAPWKLACSNSTKWPLIGVPGCWAGA